MLLTLPHLVAAARVDFDRRRALVDEHGEGAQAVLLN